MLWTLDVVERMADGKLQERSGSSSPWRRIRKLTSDERCCFEQAKHDGYVIVRRRTKDYALQNVWWRHCGALRLPHIRITPHRTPAEVEYDMLPTDGSDAGVDLKYYISGGCQIPEDLRKAFGDEWERIGRARWAPPAARGVRASYGSCCGHFIVPIEKAEDFAGMLLDKIRPLVKARIEAAHKPNAIEVNESR